MVVGWWVMVVGVVMVVGDRGLCWIVNFRKNLNFEFGGHLRTILRPEVKISYTVF